MPAEQFQSTLPRRERPDSGSGFRGDDFISIHAPAKGATQFPTIIEPKWNISIHAPAKGATCAPLFFACTIRISIHAPAKGATSGFAHVPSPCKFQSTLPRRERPIPLTLYISASRFQSTLPRRERRPGGRHPTADRNFNPRSREGSDLQDGKGYFRPAISIHAPAKGATQMAAVLDS